MEFPLNLEEMSRTMAAEIGIVKIIIANVVATAEDGLSRVLVINDKVFAGDVITTGAKAAIDIELADGSSMSLGRNSSVLLDNEVFDLQLISQSPSDDVDPSIAALQQALVDGIDPALVGESTAAGAGIAVDGNEGVRVVQILHQESRVTPESGFETTGPGFDVQTSDLLSGDDSRVTNIAPDLNDDQGGIALNTGEDTALTINANTLLANDADSDGDTLTIISVQGATNGTVVLNDDGTISFDPADNYSGPATFTYTVSDGHGGEGTATATVNIEAIADAPTLIMSIANMNAISSAQTIDLSNAASSGNGFTVTAFGLSGSASTISTVSGTDHDGFGVAGAASGAGTEIGSTASASEKLVVDFDNEVSSIDVKFAWLANIETAKYTFYLNGVIVGISQVLGAANGTTTTDDVDGVFTLSPVGGGLFDRVEFSAPLNTTDDYLIHSITFERNTAYTYDLTIAAAATDVDGSETLTGVTISNLPAGVSITSPANADGTYTPGTITIVSDHKLTAAEINAIQGSVTSTETSNGDTATTTDNVKVDASDLDSSGETADLSLKGDATANTIIGGTGDDILIGGAADDILTGGDGADLFVWHQDDVGSIAIPAHDTVTDFDVTESDILDLSDLLSDGSHTIEGVEVGSPGNEHLQLNIKDSGGNVVQEIELNGVAIVDNAALTLQSLLDDGSINDGI